MTNGSSMLAIIFIGLPQALQILDSGDSPLHLIAGSQVKCNSSSSLTTLKGVLPDGAGLLSSCDAVQRNRSTVITLEQEC